MFTTICSAKSRGIRCFAVSLVPEVLSSRLKVLLMKKTWTPECVAQKLVNDDFRVHAGVVSIIFFSTFVKNLASLPTQNCVFYVEITFLLEWNECIPALFLVSANHPLRIFSEYWWNVCQTLWMDLHVCGLRMDQHFLVAFRLARSMFPFLSIEPSSRVQGNFLRISCFSLLFP